MKVLVGQPIHEEGIVQLENEIKLNKGIDVVLYPEGYLKNQKELVNACNLAKENNITIITSYRKNNKERAVIISNHGEKVLDRVKTPPCENIELYTPLVININGIKIGYLLCMEILKGARALEKLKTDISFIAHPIGVGMFSEGQFIEWINEAKNIAKTFKTIIIGTSHSDGSYRNCGISIPISYCIDSDGEPIYISKADIRTRILNLSTKEVKVK